MAEERDDPGKKWKIKKEKWKEILFRKMCDHFSPSLHLKLSAASSSTASSNVCIFELIP